MQQDVRLDSNVSAQKAQLILKDNTTFHGALFGSSKTTSGEVVFATGMVGYPEALTDPSFAGQIVVFTYPLVGNYGVPRKSLKKYTRSVVEPLRSTHRMLDTSRGALSPRLANDTFSAISGEEWHNLDSSFESRKIWATGVVVQNVYNDTDHATAALSFSDWLKEHGVPGIVGVDTRALTQKLREEGAMLGHIAKKKPTKEPVDPNAYNIVADVSCKEPWTTGNGRKKVVLLDCGAKLNIVRELVRRDCTVEIVPWDTNVTKLDYDGLFISNGPGDPTKCRKTIRAIKAALQENKSVFGICLGNQLLALAAGAKTQKLPYGHRSQNQPCTDTTTGRCYITTQNHGFHVVGKSLPRGWKEWFVNANDGTNEGIYHSTKPFRSVQFHPEARPGPEDTAWLFDTFRKML